MMVKRSLLASVAMAALACGAGQQAAPTASTAPTMVPVASAGPAPAIEARAEDAGTALALDGDAFAAQLATFFRSRWSIPATITSDEAAHLCVVFQINVSPRMLIWHVRSQPVVASGNEAFDDSARVMLLKLLDDRTALPTPPPSIADRYRGRTLQVALAGDLRGETSRCRPSARP